jgi:hypothetical protein
MINKKIKGSIFLLFLSFMTAEAISQQAADSSVRNASIKNVIGLFNEEIAGNSHLFNAPEHRGYMRPAIGHPYFLSEDFRIGNIYYDGIFYEDIPLMYDLTKDNVVSVQFVKDSSLQYRGIFKMDLTRERTGAFSMPGHDFIKIETDTNVSSMKPGFYELLYNGNPKVLVRRWKVLVEEIKDRDLIRRYDSSNAYYILKEGVYYNVKSKNAVLDLLKDKRKEVAAYISKNRWKFRKQRETLITEAVRYYDQLTN